MSVHRGVVAGPGECMVRGGVCSQGVLAPGGCMVPGGPGGNSPWRLLMRAVRILLECTLVMILLAQPYYTIAAPKLTTLNSIEIIVKTWISRNITDEWNADNHVWVRILCIFQSIKFKFKNVGIVSISKILKVWISYLVASARRNDCTFRR